MAMESRRQNKSEFYVGLGELRSFGPDLFSSSGKAGDRLKEFILALSLFCNDLRDLVFFENSIKDIEPSGPDKQKITTKSGQYNGIKTHVTRLYISHLHELTVLLKKYSDIFNSLEFKELLRKLPKLNRKNWDTLINVLVGGDDPSRGEFKTILAKIRNTISFHYDGKELIKGYERIIFTPGNEPYISTGNSFGSFRFYYADAAAENSLVSTINNASSINYKEFSNELQDLILSTLLPLITVFVNNYTAYHKPIKTQFSEINTPQ